MQLEFIPESMQPSSTLTLDLIKDNIIKNMNEKKQLFCMRIMLVFFIVIIVPIVSLITPKMKKEKVDEIFSCFEETVVVHRKSSIEE